MPTLEGKRIQYARGMDRLIPTLKDGQFGFTKDSHKWFIGLQGGENFEITNYDVREHTLDTMAHPAEHITVTQILGIDAANVQISLEQLTDRELSVIELVEENDNRIITVESDFIELLSRLNVLDGEVLQLQEIIENLDYEELLDNIDELETSTIKYIDDNTVHRKWLGIPNGLAILDNNGRIPESMLPESEPGPTPEVQENKNAANGYCGLDGNGYILTPSIYRESISGPIEDGAKTYTDTRYNKISTSLPIKTQEIIKYTDEEVSKASTFCNGKISELESRSNEIINSFQPFRYGMISYFDGASLGGSDGKRLVTIDGIIDEQWVFCDGTNNTVNMLHRMVYGVNDGGVVGQHGGSNYITLTIDTMPSHTHLGAAHTHTFTLGVNVGSNAAGNHAHSLTNVANGFNNYATGAKGVATSYTVGSNPPVNYADAHAHNWSGSTGYAGNEQTGATGGGATYSFLPPYYLSLPFMYIGG